MTLRPPEVARLFVALATIAGTWCTFRADAHADAQPVIALEAGASLAEPSLVVGLEGGVRLGAFSILLEVDWNPFFSIGDNDVIDPGVLDVGLGLEHVFADGLLRTAIFAGTSTLLYDTAFDAAGTTGVFVEIVPLSLRLPIAASVLTLRVDPISAHLIAPVLSGLPMVRYEFRHAVSVEWSP
jgi:hypothetical protein